MVTDLRADFDRIAAGEPPDHVAAPARAIPASVAFRQRVLEIGCGTGALARAMARRGARVTAIDLSPEMIHVARSRTPGHLAIDYRVADLTRLAPRGFDIAVAVDTIRHLDLRDALTRMAAAIIPGGILRVVDEHAGWLHRRGELLSLAEIRLVAAAALPGVTLRRHLGSRYSLSWTKPPTRP